MPQHSDPFEDFFNDLTDVILEKVEQTVIPAAERLTNEIFTNAQKAMREQAHTQSQEWWSKQQSRRKPSSSPHKRGKKRRKNPGYESAPRPSRTPRTTLYDVLGVVPTAGSEVIAGAYRALAKKYHPDTGKGDEVKMRIINEAWETLQDNKRRRAYDRSIGLA